MHDQACCYDEAVNHQLANSFSLLKHSNTSFRGMLNLRQNLTQIHCSTHSVILNLTATQCTCSLNGVYQPPLTSTEKLSSFTHMHSSPISLAIRLHWHCTNHSCYIKMVEFFWTELENRFTLFIRTLHFPSLNMIKIFS